MKVAEIPPVAVEGCENLRVNRGPVRRLVCDMHSPGCVWCRPGQWLLRNGDGCNEEKSEHRPKQTQVPVGRVIVILPRSYMEGNFGINGKRGEFHAERTTTQ